MDTDTIIEIDTSEPCVRPRRPNDVKAADAIAIIGFEIVSLSDAIKGGAVLSDEQLLDMDGAARYLNRLMLRAKAAR